MDTVKLPCSPDIFLTSDSVSNSMLMCRPTSTSLGEMTHMAQSLVGNVLSSCDMSPPMEDDLSTR